MTTKPTTPRDSYELGARTTTHIARHVVHIGGELALLDSSRIPWRSAQVGSVTPWPTVRSASRRQDQALW